eukprot:gene13454-18046_t
MGCNLSKDPLPPSPEPVPIVKEDKPFSFKPVHSAIRWNKSMSDIEKLLSHPEAPDCVDPVNGNRPIHIAAQNGHLEIVRLLISKKVEVNALNSKGNSALHMAIGYDYYDAAKLLLENDANETITNLAGHQARRGIDGDKTIAIAALICAKSAEEATSALSMCESNLGELDKAGLGQAGLKAKKNLGDSWTEDMNVKLKGLLNQL